MPTGENTRLESQLAYLRSDDRLRELAALAAEMSPEQRLEQAWAMSRSAAVMLASLPAEVRERLEATRETPSVEAGPVLRHLAHLSSPAE